MSDSGRGLHTVISWGPGSKISVQADGLDGPSLEATALSASRVLRAYVTDRQRARAASSGKDTDIKRISAMFITDGGVSHE